MKLVPLSLVPQQTQTVAGALPVEISDPVKQALVENTFVAPTLSVTCGAHVSETLLNVQNVELAMVSRSARTQSAERATDEIRTSSMAPLKNSPRALVSRPPMRTLRDVLSRFAVLAIEPTDWPLIYKVTWLPL
jgi:hypothetical protein